MLTGHILIVSLPVDAAVRVSFIFTRLGQALSEGFARLTYRLDNRRKISDHCQPSNAFGSTPLTNHELAKLQEATYSSVFMRHYSFVQQSVLPPPQ